MLRGVLLGQESVLYPVEVVNLDRRKHDEIGALGFRGVVRGVGHVGEAAHRGGALLEEEIHLDGEVQPARRKLVDHVGHVTQIRLLKGLRVGRGAKVVTDGRPVVGLLDLAVLDAGALREAIAPAIEHADGEKDRLARRLRGPRLRVHEPGPFRRRCCSRLEGIPRDAIKLLVDLESVVVVREVGGSNLEPERRAAHDELHAARRESERLRRAPVGRVGPLRAIRRPSPVNRPRRGGVAGAGPRVGGHGRRPPAAVAPAGGQRGPEAAHGECKERKSASHRDERR